MPLHDLKCLNKGCGNVMRDIYISKHGNPNPLCRACGAATGRMVTSFATPWLKPIQEYGNPNLENFHKGVKEGGHWVARKRSGGGTDEAPKREFIQTIAQQRAYCREEGLIPPDDCSSVPMSIKSDGKAVNNSCGETGCWV